MFRDYIHLSINGKLQKISGKYAFLPLSDLLRYGLSLTGTKIVCAEGDCGACTVMFRRPQSDSKKFQSLNSCIATTFLLDGAHLITVEDIQQKDDLSEIQESMVRNFGGQCGFCTPGFVMSITNMYEQKSAPTEQNVKNYLTGNLCRCTGYTPIIQAALDVDVKKIKPLDEKHDFQKLATEIAPDLVKPIKIVFENKEFFAPTTLKEAAEYKNQNPTVRIFSGATDLGVQINKGKNPGQKMMSLHLINDLYELKIEDEWIKVGARVNLDRLQKFVEKLAPEFAQFLNIFASPQIKNTATLVGNLANGSPIADTTPYLLTADAQVNLLSVDGPRTLALNDFIKGYKSFDMKENEFITGTQFKAFKANTQKIGIYKISQRRDLDISAVNSSFVLELENKKIISARLAFGGVGPKAIRLSMLEKSLIGKSVNPSLIEETRKLIADNITPIADVRGSAEFRKLMAQDLFSKFAQEHLES
jgi:xanthine dehydrogenase small subunit